MSLRKFFGICVLVGLFPAVQASATEPFRCSGVDAILTGVERLAIDHRAKAQQALIDIGYQLTAVDPVMNAALVAAMAQIDQVGDVPAMGTTSLLGPGPALPQPGEAHVLEYSAYEDASWMYQRYDFLRDFVDTKAKSLAAAYQQGPPTLWKEYLYLRVQKEKLQAQERPARGEYDYSDDLLEKLRTRCSELRFRGVRSPGRNVHDTGAGVPLEPVHPSGAAL
jgi:hypothetical protein